MRVRCIWHYIAGFIAGIAGAWCISAPPTGTACFIIYEIKQDFDKNAHNSHKDIVEFCIGLFIGLACIIPIKVLGVA